MVKVVTIILFVEIFLTSCLTAQIQSSGKQRLGTVNAIFENDYLSIKIPNRWIVGEYQDENYILELHKGSDVLRPTINFNIHEKKLNYNYSGSKNIKQYLGFSNKSLSDAGDRYSLISEMDSIIIDKRKFYVSRFILTTGENQNIEFLKTFYLGELDDNYFIQINTIENNKIPDLELQMILKGIKFK
jgi:hypothetical protein